jgi:hypothetical protein
MLLFKVFFVLLGQLRFEFYQLLTRDNFTGCEGLRDTGILSPFGSARGRSEIGGTSQ